MYQQKNKQMVMCVIVYIVWTLLHCVGGDQAHAYTVERGTQLRLQREATILRFP